MKPAERIPLLKKIAQELGTHGWREIELTLRQFGFRTSDLWNSSDGSLPAEQAYVLDMIESGPDEKILELADYLQVASLGIDTVRVSQIWKPGYFPLFLSHVSAIKESVANLQTALRAFAISGFVAHVDIEPTREWQDEIETALLSCQALCALLTPDFPQSKWTDQEVGICRGRGVFIIPVKLGLDPYGFIGKYQAVNGKGKTAAALATEIFGLLKADSRTMPSLKQAVINNFVNSDSFKEAKDNIGLLEQFDYFDSVQLNEIESANRNNGQIQGSFGVPARVELLIKKFRKPQQAA